MIESNLNVTKKFVNTEILNQNSYEVISDKLYRNGLKFNDGILKDIKETLKLLS